MKRLLSLLCLTGLLVSCGAADKSAELGDPAAELQIKTWIKGEPVKVTGDGKGIYVVEFWATWCPPCRTSIPHLTEVQKRFKDKNVVIIGISNEDDRTVKRFVESMGSKMDYTVATDDGDKTTSAYMMAYGARGIPHAFIVQNKKVIWEGHPMDGLDKALEEIVAGKMDLNAVKATHKAKSLYARFQEAVSNGNDQEADEIAAELKTVSQGVKGVFPNDTFDPARERQEVTKQRLVNELAGALFEENTDQAKAVEQKLKEIDPSIDIEGIRREVSYRKVANQYFRRASEGELDEETRRLGKELAEVVKGYPRMGDAAAWTILTNERLKNRDVPLALQISKQACEDSKWEVATFLDTYARALFDSGKKEEAVRYQQQAIEKSTDPQEKQQFEENLAAFRQKS